MQFHARCVSLYGKTERALDYFTRYYGGVMESEKMKAVVDACLETFVEKGLSETTSRDLSRAMKLQSGGLYYYFASKDEAVVACAEAAALRLENGLIFPALDSLDDPDRMMKLLKENADTLAPTMCFLSQVCSSSRYRDKMAPIMKRLCSRYGRYAQAFAERLCCEKETVEPYVYLGITAVTNYMIFGEKDYIVPQTELIRRVVKKLREEAELKSENL